MFKITLDTKGRNSVWVSGVRRKSQCEGEIKAKPSKLPENHRQTGSAVFPRHPDSTFPEARQKVKVIVWIFIKK